MGRLYRLHGLNVACDMPLPCPPAVGEGVDLSIHWSGRAHCSTTALSSQSRVWIEDGGKWLLRYCRPDGMYIEFLLEPDGSALTIRHQSPFEWPEFLPALLGPAMGATLQLRQIPILHGGAVSVGGGAVLLLGPSGAGKSTLTAALVNAGYPLICEELAALRQGSDGSFVEQGHPLLKLSSGSIQSLQRSPETLPLAFPEAGLSDERWLDARDLSGGFHAAPAPLRAVYFIAGRCSDIQTTRFEEVSPGRACLTLRNCFYGADWLHAPVAEGIDFCAQVTRTTPVRLAWLPEGIDSVATSALALVDDVLSRATFHPPGDDFHD